MPAEGAVDRPPTAGPIGRVTSAKWSPTLDRPIGLAWLAADAGARRATDHDPPGRRRDGRRPPSVACGPSRSTTRPASGCAHDERGSAVDAADAPPPERARGRPCRASGRWRGREPASAGRCRTAIDAGRGTRRPVDDRAGRAGPRTTSWSCEGPRALAAVGSIGPEAQPGVRDAGPLRAASTSGRLADDEVRARRAARPRPADRRCRTRRSRSRHEAPLGRRYR